MKYIILLYFILFGFMLAAQNTLWDNTINTNWPENFTKVNIECTFDTGFQPCMIYKTTCSKPQPLIVSLHIWSGNYLQQDSLSYFVAERNWNYIHPDFRGPNNQPLAMGSFAVISDIEDAIRFAIKNMNVDTSEVHIIGVSGGAYATLLCYMKLNYPAKSFNSLAGISDLKAWYEESIGRKQKYAEDILKSTSSKNCKLNNEEAIKRSPIYMNPSKHRGKLYLYEGIHDGYQGSLPITQTLNMYNRIVSKLYPNSTQLLIKESEILDMVVKRWLQDVETQRTLSNRKVHYFKDNKNVSLCIFEGAHEQLIPVALSLIPEGNSQPNKRLHILTLGDSNGTFSYGWPQQLKDEIPYVDVLSISRVGKTIGFNNNGDSTLNQLATLENDLLNANIYIGLEEYDYIVIGLGTNDAKYDFRNNQNEVYANLELLIKRLQTFQYKSISMAKIVIKSPTPYGIKSQSQAKYVGGNDRVKEMNTRFKEIAQKYNCIFVDTFTSLCNDIEILSNDGLHLNEVGQKKIADLIAIEIKKAHY
ncbi:MAG: GDSL-type esterase/lipase family protein [Paludibacter sp.]|nr:GDSL-type esterase/lipase family protein [Paludibacter sp.]